MDIKFINCIVVHPVKYICIGIQCYMDISMSKPFLKHYCRYTGFNTSGCKSMSQ